MKLDGNRWHVRWFHFVQARIGDHDKYRRGTNLCHFMRVTVLWGALMLLLVATAIGFVLFALVIGPIMGGGLLLLLTIWTALAFAVAVAWFIGFVIGKYGAKIGGPFHCAYEHARAIKGRFCPVVTFSRGNT